MRILILSDRNIKEIINFTMTTSSRSQRKRKQAEFFSPISRQEETSLVQALRNSLKEIPSDGSESEDNESSEERN